MPIMRQFMGVVAGALLVLGALGQHAPATPDASTWVTTGPYQPLPVRALAIDPAGQATVYAGTSQNGVFKSNQPPGHDPGSRTWWYG